MRLRKKMAEMTDNRPANPVPGKDPADLHANGRVRSPARRTGMAGVLGSATLSVLGAVVMPPLAHGEDVAGRVCHDAPIMARGEPSRFEWLARTKARANWRHKVRSTPGLGTAYSDWKAAANLEDSCLSGPQGTVCMLTAVPCRK